MTKTPSLPSRALLALLAVALVTAGCGRFARRGGLAAPSPTAKVTYGSGITVQDPLSTGTAKKATTGSLEIRVLDATDGTPLKGIVVRYRGPQTARASTNAKGISRVSLKPGAYEVEVLECGDTLVVDERVKADATVVAGSVTRGQLTVSYYDRRFKPVNSIETSRPAPWTRNDRVVLGVRIEDSCNHAAIARNIPVSEFRWRATPTLKVIDTPERSDATGFARVTVACVGAGDADLVMYLPGADPPLEVNVIDAMSRPFAGDWCE